MSVEPTAQFHLTMINAPASRVWFGSIPQGLVARSIATLPTHLPTQHLLIPATVLEITIGTPLWDCATSAVDQLADQLARTTELIAASVQSVTNSTKPIKAAMQSANHPTNSTQGRSSASWTAAEPHLPNHRTDLTAVSASKNIFGGIIGAESIAQLLKVQFSRSMHWTANVWTCSSGTQTHWLVTWTAHAWRDRIIVPLREISAGAKETGNGTIRSLNATDYDSSHNPIICLIFSLDLFIKN